MLIDEAGAEQRTEVFHHDHQTLTEKLQIPTVEPAESWDELPQAERDRLIAAARLTLEPDCATARRKYFAKPGEAEWGC